MTQSQWTELALVEIQKQGGSPITFGGLTDTIDVDIGDRAIETTALINGGKVVKYTPMDDTTITLEMFPVGATAVSATPTGLTEWFFGDEGGTAHAGGGTYWTNKLVRYEFRVVLLWTSIQATGGMSGVLPSDALASGDHLRMSFWGCYFTSNKFSYTDDMMTSPVNFVCPGYDKGGNGQIAIEEADSATLPAMDNFTTSNTLPSWS